MKKHIITEQEYISTTEAAKKNTLKRVDKRLQVIILRYEGWTGQAIGDKLGYSRKRVSQLCAEFKTVGLAEYARHKYGGNNRALRVEQEREILEKFEKEAEKGHIVTVRDIKAAFDAKRGKESRSGYIYEVLARVKWRKVMPRSKHPKKASEEAIEASKKLSKLTAN
jgi:transposase